MRSIIRYGGSPLLTIVLLVSIGFALLVLAPSVASVHLPGNQQGYEPAQPIAFSHRLHAGEMQVDCLYCHSGAERSRHAGIPAASVCMNCHRFVQATAGAVRAEDELAKREHRQPHRVMSPEIAKLYAALALREDGTRDPRRTPSRIQWMKIHSVPDFVYFDHRPHVNAGVACQVCHGPVETMERVRQVSDLSMGMCVNCHRQINRAGLTGKGDFTSAAAPASRGVVPVTHKLHASTDCTTCHY